MICVCYVRFVRRLRRRVIFFYQWYWANDNGLIGLRSPVIPAGQTGLPSHIAITHITHHTHKNQQSTKATPSPSETNPSKANCMVQKAQWKQNLSGARAGRVMQAMVFHYKGVACDNVRLLGNWQMPKADQFAYLTAYTKSKRRM